MHVYVGWLVCVFCFRRLGRDRKWLLNECVSFCGLCNSYHKLDIWMAFIITVTKYLTKSHKCLFIMVGKPGGRSGIWDECWCLVGWLLSGFLCRLGPLPAGQCEQCAVGKDPGLDIRNPESLGHQHECQCSPFSVPLEEILVIIDHGDKFCLPSGIKLRTLNRVF